MVHSDSVQMDGGLSLMRSYEGWTTGEVLILHNTAKIGLATGDDSWEDLYDSTGEELALRSEETE